MLWVWTIIGAALATGPAERLAEAQFALERRDPEAAQTVLDTPFRHPGLVTTQHSAEPSPCRQCEHRMPYNNFNRHWTTPTSCPLFAM